VRALFFDVGLVGRAVGFAAFVLLLSGRTVASAFTLAVASAVASAIMFATASTAVSTVATAVTTAVTTADVRIAHCDGDPRSTSVRGACSCDAPSAPNGACVALIRLTGAMGRLASTESTSMFDGGCGLR
jgi:hypothetical protein